MEVKREILESNEGIVKILDYYGYANIRDRGKEIRCGIDENSNPTSILVRKDENISTIDFARNIKGDIFTLIMNQKGLSFRDVINDIKNLLDIEINYIRNGNRKDSVASIFDDLVFNDEEKLDIYDENILNNYSDLWSKKFYNDGISIETQKKFDIRYDLKTHRIVIPHRTPEGFLCGVIGRVNYPCGKFTSKYLPLISYKKSETLFGYSQNYKYLYMSEIIYIGESEKFVMQLDSMGYNNAISLMGSSISNKQCLLVRYLNIKKIVFCFDEGLQEEVI